MAKKSIILLFPILVALSLVYLPNFWIHVLLLVDFYTPWVLFESPLYAAYHKFLGN